uniref:Bestrophin homolog n=1 Tax=Plectus sambesii TaxID=2011161 RepID=A0A914VG12_9BILA
MTITYTLDVSKSHFSSYWKFLLRWRGSVWKSIYRELLVWLAVYSILSCIYRMLLNDEQKIAFEDIAEMCYNYFIFIPLSLMLAFFVCLVITRWWDMFNNIGWIDNIALYIAAYIEGVEDDVRMTRRNIIRYLVLVQAMVFRDISPPIRQRFPTMHSLQEAGFLNQTEMNALDGVESSHAKYWLPVHWAMMLISKAREDGHMKNDDMVTDLYNRLREYRTGLGTLSCYDWVPLPLVYTQVMFLTARFYYLIALMGRQYITTDRSLNVKSPIDLYFPFLTVIELIIYMGWMRVAESLLNPFGSYEDDFEVNYLLDRNLQVGMTIVDSAIGSLPAQEKDQFWHVKHPTPLYSEKMADVQMNPAVGSATKIPEPEKNTLMVQRKEESSSRKSSRQQIGVGSLLKNIKNFGRRPSPIGEGFKSMTMADTEKAAVFPTADKDLSLAKTLPSKLNELVQGNSDKPDFHPTSTAPAKLQTMPNANTKIEQNEETAQYLSTVLEQDELGSEVPKQHSV